MIRLNASATEDGPNEKPLVVPQLVATVNT